MTAYDYTGSAVTAALVRDTNTGATTYTAQSWTQGFGPPVLYQSFTTDIRSAGDYVLKIDGVTVASVSGVAAAATGVAFTPASPIELLPGEHDFSLECTSGAVTWYARGNDANGVGAGAGWYAQAWGHWIEPASGISVPGSQSFTIADVALQSGIVHDSLSSGSFSGMTWDVTFDTEVWLFGVIKREFAADTYTLLVDSDSLASVTKAAATGSVQMNFAYCPPEPYVLAAGAREFNVDPTANRRMVFDNGLTSAPSGSGSSHTTAWGPWQEASTNKVGAQLWFMLPVAPEAPEDLAADPASTSVLLTWSPPSTGPDPVGYEVRVDGGSWTDVGNVTSYNVTFLDPETTYDFDVRAYNATGASDPASVEATTEALPTADGWYRVVGAIDGEELWDVSRGECAGEGPMPGFGVLLPLSWGWRTAEKDPLPTQPDATMLSFRMLAPSPDDSSVAGLVPGATVDVTMHVDSEDPDAVWQHFAGVIVTATGEFLPWGDGQAWVVTVQAADGTAALGDIIVGYGAIVDPWPLETIEDRVIRLQEEMDMTLNEGDELTTVTWLQEGPTGIPGTGPLWGNQAGLAPRAASPTSVLAVIQAALRQLAAEGELPTTDPVWGRWVYYWDQATYTLTVTPWWRYGLEPIILDGCHVSTKATWVRINRGAVYQWAIVDNVVYPFVASWQTPPFTATTSWVDAGSGVDEPIDSLVQLALNDDFTQLEGWRTRRIRYEASSDPFALTLVAGLASTGLDRYHGLQPVIVDNLDPGMEVNGVAYLAGVLSGARVVIPPGGDYFMELDLRPELPPDVTLPE